MGLIYKKIELKIVTFSITQTLISLPFYCSIYFNFMAVESPAGPPPTINTSYSISSLSMASEQKNLRFFLFIPKILLRFLVCYAILIILVKFKG